MLRHPGLLLAAILLLLTPPVAQSANAPLRLAVASNFLLPARELAQAFERTHGIPVSISSGSTGRLYAQILHGARYDIFLAANSREPERLERQGKVVAGSRFTYAIGRLVLWSLDPALLAQDPAQRLRRGELKSLALANPNTAPYGAAGQQVLTRLKVSPGAFRRMRAENVTQAFQYVATGNVQAGFVAWSQLVSANKQKTGSHWLVDPQLYTPIRQQAVWLKQSGDNTEAKAFLEFLRSTKGQSLVKRYGYRLDKS